MCVCVCDLYPDRDAAAGVCSALRRRQVILGVFKTDLFDYLKCLMSLLPDRESELVSAQRLLKGQFIQKVKFSHDLAVNSDVHVLFKSL